MKMFWEKWGSTIKVATAALVVLFVYSSLRESFALSLADRTQEVLKSQAKTVAGLKGRAASENGIRKYIRDNKKRAADLKTLASVANMNSALDIAKKINDAAPPKSSITLDIQQMAIQDAQVTLQGYVNSPREMSLLQQALTNVSTDGQVKSGQSTLSAMPGRTAFSFSFNVDRNVEKVTR